MLAPLNVILMRHGESANNIMVSNQSHDQTEFQKQRSPDPDMTEKGYVMSAESGKFLKRLEIKIDKFYTTGFLRAIQTIKQVRKEYGEGVPVEIFNQVHECCGCHKEDKVFPGLKRSEML